MIKLNLIRDFLSQLVYKDIFGNIQIGPHSHYAALVVPPSSQPLQPNLTLVSDQKAGIEDTKYQEGVEDTSYSVTNHSDGIDIIKAEDVTSISNDIRETSKVGEMILTHSLSDPLAQQYARRNIQYHKLYEDTQGEL